MAKYPEYPIPQYPQDTTQVWRNMVSQLGGGREQRRRKSTFPTYDLTLTYNGLETADIDRLWNFYQDMAGTFHEFYFFTPFDESHKGLFVGVGDGVKDTYDLPGIVAGVTTVYVDGIPSAVTLLSGGGDEGADRCDFSTASGAISRNALKISAANGYAFVDFADAGIFAGHIASHSKLTITDSAGKELVGYLKAAGTGETYGNELITNGDFENGLTGWSIAGVPNANNYAEAVSGGARLVLATSNAVYIRQPVPSDLRLCLTSIAVVDRSGMTLRFGHWAAGYDYHSIDAIGTHTVRKTNTVASLVVSGTPGWAEFTNVSMRQILSPAETGVTITSTPDGAIYDWASKDEGFNFYDGAGYDWKISLPPVAGAVISCDLFGQQRIRCRFAEDNLSKELFMTRIYRTGIKLKGLKG